MSGQSRTARAATSACVAKPFDGAEVGRQDDDGQKPVSRLLAKRPRHVESVHDGHVPVGEDHAGPRLADAAEPLLAVTCLDDVEACLFQVSTEQSPHQQRVVDDERRLAHDGGGSHEEEERPGPPIPKPRRAPLIAQGFRPFTHQ